MKKEFLLTSSLIILGALSAVGQTKRPNVVYINADDLGYGDLSCNGMKRIQTPNVDRVASQGVRHTNMHTTSATSTPSRFSLLTGQYAWRVKGTGIARGDAAMVVKPEMQTLPDMMHRAGYTTAAVGKWHLGLGAVSGKQNWNGEITPGLVDIGFDYSYIMAATGDRVPCVYIENARVVGLDPNDPIQVSYTTPFEGLPTGKNNPEMLKLHPSHGHDQALINGISRIGYMKGGQSALWKDEEIADRITGAAVDFIEREAKADHPFFLYFCTNDIHVPRAPHDRFVGLSGMGARGDAILEFDWSVGRVLDVLDSLGIADNTLVIITSDNGPVVDDGYRDRAVELLGDHKPWGAMRGGKYSIFEAGTRVPMLARMPGLIKAGTVSGAALSNVDIFASLAALVGVELVAGEAPDSENQLLALVGRDKKGRRYIVEDASTRSITCGDWKYIRPNNGAAYSKYTNTEYGNDPQDQLYNLRRDYGERINVAAEHPRKVAELKALLAGCEARASVRESPETTESYAY
ncbi:MAG: arylsulfatase [Mucinivorans sp.]